MKLAIISGGSKGLGAALCQTYIGVGFEVIEFSRSAPHPFSVACDFAEPEQLAKTMRKRLAQLGECTLEEVVAISNAASLDPIGPSHRLDAQEIQRNLNTSFVSAIVFMSETLRRFQGEDCRKTLVNISSGAALKGHAGWSLYCAGKAGLDNHIRALAAEQALEASPFGVLSIDPGIMDTEMQAFIRKTSVDNFPTRERFVGFHRDGALRSPSAIATAVAHIVAGEHESGSRLVAADFI